MADARRCWIGVAARSHVRRGVEGGFCQLGHGKHEPVKRLKPGDLIAYYAPREEMSAGAIVQAFVAIGEIRAGEPYEAETGPSFQAWRRNVDWWQAHEAPIKPLIPALSFIKDPVRWGYPLRRGSFTVPREDFARIAEAMGVDRGSVPP